MQQRHSIRRGGERNWENAHKPNSNVKGIKTPIFGAEFDKKKFCGWDVIDQAAEAQMNKGYSKAKNPVCERCFVQKSISGACNC
jgi:hypothetical protein